MENWDLLFKRVNGKSQDLLTRLALIHNRMYDELRKSGHLLKIINIK